MTSPRPPLHGRKLGDRRVVVNRPHSAFFRYAGPGTMVAKAAASAPTTAVGKRIARVRAFVFGKPLANEQEIGERLSKKLALPIFSSDAISSSAYATDEILKVLILGGLACTDAGPSGWRRRHRADARPSSLSAIARYAERTRPAAAPTSSLGRTSGHPSAHRRLGAHGRLRHDRRGFERFCLANLAAAIPAIDHTVSSWPPCHGPGDGGQPAWHSRVGQHLRPAHVPLRRHGAAGNRGWARQLVDGQRPCPGRDAVRGYALAPGRRRGPIPAAQGLRRRLGGPDRRRGDRQRRPVVQAA
jgi:hypothetical protein